MLHLSHLYTTIAYEYFAKHFNLVCRRRIDAFHFKRDWKTRIEMYALELTKGISQTATAKFFVLPRVIVVSVYSHSQ